MRISNIKNKNKINFCASISSAKFTPEILTIPIISGYQLYNNYQKADKSERKNVLFRDLIVLSSTCLGALGGVKILPKIYKKTNVLLNQVVGLPLGGIVGGIIAGEITEKIFPIKYPQLETNLAKKYEEIQKNESEREKKSRVFKTKVKKLLILLSTSAGVVGGFAGSNKALKSKSLSKFSNNSINKNIFGVSAILASGLAASVIARFILNKILPKNEELQFKPLDDFTSSYGYIVPELNAVFSNTFNNTFTTLNSFSVGREVGRENRLKKGFFEIITGIVIPFVTIIPFSNFLKNKFANPSNVDKLALRVKKITPKSLLKIMPKKQIGIKIFEKALLIPVTTISIYIGSKIGSWFNEKITEKVLKQQLWAQLNVYRKNLIKENLVAMGSANEKFQKDTAEKLAKIQELSDKIINSLS